MQASVDDVVAKLPTEKGKMTTAEWEQACISDASLDEPRVAMRRALTEGRVKTKAAAQKDDNGKYAGVKVWAWREV